MKFKYVLNLNSNHRVDYSFPPLEKVTDVFESLLPSYYKNEYKLRDLCRKRISRLKEDDSIGYDEPVYIIYSGLAVVMLAFINELIKEGYRPIVLFEDKDNGKYYKLEVEI